MKKFNHLVYAGTFDRLHVGHKKLLDKAFELAEKVSIGITTEKLYRLKPLVSLIYTSEVRYRAVQQYLQERNWLKRTRFFKLNDIYGPSIIDKTMDSILVTELTKANAEKINKIRIKKGLPTLRIIVAPLVMGEDGKVVTSERIRAGEIDRYGHRYSILDIRYSKSEKRELLLPKYLRKALREPLGLVINGSEDQLLETAGKTVQSINRLYIKPPLIISVGDIVTNSLLKIGFEPDVIVIDFRTRRKDIGQISNIKNQIAKLQIKNQIYKITNKPGTVNIQAGKKINLAIKKYLETGMRQILIVEGEEDLLALPAILLAPLNSVVLYGQIDMGVIVVDVTEEKKKEVEKILKKFK